MDLITINSTLNYNNTEYILDVVYSIKFLNKWNSIFNMLSLIFFIIVLFSSIYFMNKDFSQLILTPLERML
jgi:hypothetical protein